MKMTITLDGAPDDFAPVLAGLGCVETTPPEPPLPDDPVTWFRSKLKAAGLHSEDVAAAVGLAPSGLSARVRGRTPWSLPEAAGGGPGGICPLFRQPEGCPVNQNKKAPPDGRDRAEPW